MLVPLIFFILVIVGIVFLVQHFPLDIGRGLPGSRAADLLDERYAKGEIDREEYLRRRQDIKGV